MTQATKVQKQVQIIARYLLKKSGIICYAVRSSNGTDIYHTCIANGRASCTCPGFEKFHKCYHSAQILVLEQSRSKTQAAKVEQALAEAWQLVEANWQEAEVESERSDYLVLTGQTTQDTISHIEAELAGYDVIGAALSVVNAEIVSQAIGDAYEQRAAQMRTDAETRRCYYEMSIDF